MVENIQEEKQIESDKSNLGSVLSTSIYAATVIMIVAYLYQSFAAHIFGD